MTSTLSIWYSMANTDPYAQVLNSLCSASIQGNALAIDHNQHFPFSPFSFFFKFFHFFILKSFFLLLFFNNRSPPRCKMHCFINKCYNEAQVIIFSKLSMKSHSYNVYKLSQKQDCIGHKKWILNNWLCPKKKGKRNKKEVPRLQPHQLQQLLLGFYHRKISSTEHQLLLVWLILCMEVEIDLISLQA